MLVQPLSAGSGEFALFIHKPFLALLPFSKKPFVDKEQARKGPDLRRTFHDCLVGRPSSIPDNVDKVDECQYFSIDTLRIQWGRLDNLGRDHLNWPMQGLR